MGSDEKKIAHQRHITLLHLNLCHIQQGSNGNTYYIYNILLWQFIWILSERDKTRLKIQYVSTVWK